MRGWTSYLLAAAVLLGLLLSVPSCRRARVIPKEEFAALYADLFLADQWMRQHEIRVRQRDTMSVYRSVLEAHGYTESDYQLSADTYLKDPDRYAKVLRRMVQILKDRQQVLMTQKEERDRVAQLLRERALYRPDTLFFLTGLQNPAAFRRGDLRLAVDTTGGEWTFDARIGQDTAYYGPLMRIAPPDSLKARLDSLRAAADSLKAVSDSLKATSGRLLKTLDTLFRTPADSLHEAGALKKQALRSLPEDKK